MLNPQGDNVLKSLLFFIGFLFHITEANCQTVLVTADSLRNQIERGSNQTKLASYEALFNFYYDLQNDSAVLVAKEFREVATEIGEPIDVVISLECQAIAYDYFLSDYSKAFASYEEALDICELHDLDYQVYILHGIAILFHLSDDYNKAMDYYQQALELIPDGQDVAFKKKVMVNMASIQSSLVNYDEAEKLFLQAIEMERSDDPFLEASNLSGLANLYIRKDQPTKAIPHLLKAIEINMVNQIDGETLYEYSYLIDAKVAANHLDGMDTLLQVVIGHIDDRTQLRSRIIIDYSIYKAYQALGQFEKASAFQDEYILLYDSFKIQQRSDIVYELEAKYDNERKEKEIAELEIEQQKSQNQRNIFIFLAVIVVLVSVLLFGLLRAKSKTNAIISETLRERETLLKEIHHRVKNNLQIISSLLNLQASYLEDNEAKEAVKEGQNRVKSMALIHQKLYQNDDITGIEVNDYIENLTHALFNSFGADPEAIRINLDIDQLMLDIDTLIPLGLVLNELVSNALKYAFPNGNGLLKISLNRMDDALRLVIKDDGPGMDETELETSNSYGWKMIRSLSRKLKADIGVVNSNGTEVTLQIKNFKLVA